MIPDLEITFQTRLMLALAKRPTVRVWRVNVGTVERKAGGFFHAGPPKGAADVAGIIGPEGWALQIECKAAGRKRKPEQIAWAEMVTALGAVYLLADARDGVEATLARLDAMIAERRGGTRCPRCENGVRVVDECSLCESPIYKTCETCGGTGKAAR